MTGLLTGYGPSKTSCLIVSFFVTNLWQLRCWSLKVSLFIILHFFLMTYKYAWPKRGLTNFLYKSLPSLFTYYSLHTQIVVKIVFKSASFIKQFESSFLFTKILYQALCPEKNSLGKFCGLHYVRVQTQWPLLIMLSTILWISQKVEQMNTWKSSSTNWASACTENCTTYCSRQLLKSSLKCCKMIIFFPEDMQLEERIQVSKHDFAEQSIHGPLQTSMSCSRLRLR